MRKRAILVGLMITSIGAAVSASIILPGTWQAVTNGTASGYDAVYDASQGHLPDASASNPKWGNRYMSAGIVGTYLSITNTAQDGTYRLLDGSVGAGTYDGSMTIDFRLEVIPDAGTPNDWQFGVYIRRPLDATTPAATSNIYYIVRFGLNGGNVQLADGWNDVRILVDAVNHEAAVYLNGESTATATINGTRQTGQATAGNSLIIGDGGGSTTGSGAVNLQYFAWANNEMASVIPEPATIGLFVFSSVLLMVFRKKLHKV